MFFSPIKARAYVYMPKAAGSKASHKGAPVLSGGLCVCVSVYIPMQGPGEKDRWAHTDIHILVLTWTLVRRLIVLTEATRRRDILEMCVCVWCVCVLV